jgi:hypothetical protein
MGDAVKEGSANAGTVITIALKLKFAPKKIYVPAYQIDGVYYFHQDILLWEIKNNRIKEKNTTNTHKSSQKNLN